MAAADGPASSSPQWRLQPLARLQGTSTQFVTAGSRPTEDVVRKLLSLGGDNCVLILQKVMPSARALRELKEAYVKVVFDLDTAIYASPTELELSRPLGALKRLRRFALRGSTTASSRRRPLIEALRGVDLCVVGNSNLEKFAGRFAPQTVQIPTGIEPVSAPPGSRPEIPVVVWMGHRDNIQYLELVRSALEELANRCEFRLRIVSHRAWDDPPVPAEFIPWTRASNSEALLTSTVGLSPLPDDEWNRGRSASRLIHYGGHALPAVASPVGMSEQVVLHGRTGFLASSMDEWVNSVQRLLSEPKLVDEMGANALGHVTAHYSEAVALELWRKALSYTRA